MIRATHLSLIELRALEVENPWRVETWRSYLEREGENHRIKMRALARKLKKNNGG